MNAKTRRIWAGTLFAIALFFAIGAWTHKPSGSDDDGDNQGGVLIALICLLALAYLYFSSAGNWLVAKGRQGRRMKGSKPSSENDDV